MDCPECKRLWSLHRDLLQDQVDLMVEYHQAVAKSENLADLGKFEDALEGAARFRRLSGERLLVHTAMHSRASAA